MTSELDTIRSPSPPLVAVDARILWAPKEQPVSFKFLHAADVHLDSPLKGLALRSEDRAEEIRGGAAGLSRTWSLPLPGYEFFYAID